MEPNILCQCGTFYSPNLTACPWCGRLKHVDNTLGNSVSRWDEWLAKQDAPLPFDDSLDALEPADYDDDEIECDGTGNANIDAFLKGMRW